MLAGQGRRLSTLREGDLPHCAIRPPPTSFLGKCKYYYDKYKFRHFAPFLLLLIYSFVGAWIFYVVEHEYEVEVKRKEAYDLERLRNATFTKLAMISRSGNGQWDKGIVELIKYEKDLRKVQLPECLDWDMWGAFFYVGTIYTTIGWGNIAPRTSTGQALSVVYAILGIPLVLAILSQFGRVLTNWVSDGWQKYRRYIKEAGTRTKNRLRKRRQPLTIQDVEEGKVDTRNMTLEELESIEDGESRTIPIWLALCICIGWVCFCAALFLIWEEKWTFFKSLYFMCISLSTIGLGDVVPDHPHMLILMFWLVIIGLSIVSMLLSVIQIKMEEWLCTLMIKMQKEYQKALAEGGYVNKDELIERMMADEPFWMRNLLAPTLFSDQQNIQLEQKAEQYEKLIKETNNKNIQTDFQMGIGAETQVETNANSIACDPMSESSLKSGQHNDEKTNHRHTQWSRQYSDSYHDALPELLPPLHSIADDRDSVSDATSLPLDSIMTTGRKSSDKKKVAFCETCARKEEEAKTGAAQSIEQKAEMHCQTDIAQFQIDEIALRLASLQTQRIRPRLMERSMETSITEQLPPDPPQAEDRSIQCGDLARSMTDQEVLTEILNVMTRSMETEAVRRSMADLAINTSPPVTVSCETEMIGRHSITTSAGCSPRDRLLTIDAETQRDSDGSGIDGDEDREWIDSGIVKRKDAAVETFASALADEMRKNIEMEERAVQTAIVKMLDRVTSPIHAHHLNNRSQQTSLSEDLLETKKRRAKSKDANYSDGSASDGSIKINARSKKNHPMNTSVEISTQYSPPLGYRDNIMAASRNSEGLSVTHRARSSSTSGMGTSIFDEEHRQEVVVQTDDSYLKIARRLDEYRNNRTQFLPVCAATPMDSKSIEPFKSDRPSERRGFYLDPSFGGRKRSWGTRRRKVSKKENDTQTGQSMDQDALEEALSSVSHESPI